MLISLGDKVATPDNADKLCAHWELAMRDPLYFLRWFVWTMDQHDKDNPIKQFPWQKKHLRLLVDLWKDNRLLSIVKCRQIVATWLFAALSLWDVLHPGRFVIMQSKKLADAVGSETTGDGPLGRAKFIYGHIPGREVLCPPCAGGTRIGTIGTFDKLEFPSLNSGLLAIPQGGNIIRQRTVSGIFSDETAFQEECSEAYVAARPCIRGGGWFVSLTTADLSDGGHTKRLHLDDLEEW